MASVSNDGNGRRRILFTNADGERKAIRVGKMTAKAAEFVCNKVERILEAQLSVSAIDAETARWLGELPDTLHKRLVAVGLTESRTVAAVTTLDGLLQSFFTGVDVKPSTLTRMTQAKAALLAYFTPVTPIDSITDEQAELWRADMRKQGYAPATISRTVLYARQIFRWAIKRKLLTSNPFAEVRAGSQVNQDRAVFVAREIVDAVIDKAPDAEWQLLIALSRYGGLRVPSEALALRWSDINWSTGAMRVRSSKTEHHEGKAERTVPLFAEVRTRLEAVRTQMSAGSTHVIQRYQSGANLNPHLRRLIKRAGFTPWERTWHNMRASRQTELTAEFPLHTVCAWLGNSKPIAAGHYLQITDADWQRATGVEKGGANSGAPAAHFEAQQPAASDRTVSHERPQTPVVQGSTQNDATPRQGARGRRMGRAGLEPATPAFSMRCSTIELSAPEVLPDPTRLGREGEG